MSAQTTSPEFHLELELDNGIACLIINRAEKKNALTKAMWQEIPKLIDEVNQNKAIRVLVIKGGGKFDFCAGADIGEFLTVRGNKTTAQSYEKDNHLAFEAIKNCQKPTIAMIRGICFGGGFGIAASCDLRVAAKSARFAIPAAKLGLAYPLDSISYLITALGEQNTKALVLSGQEFSSKQVHKMGFLFQKTQDESLETATQQLAATIAQNAPKTLRATKQGIAAYLSKDSKDWELAQRLGIETFDSKDYQEGILAFKERRKAIFTGE